MVSTHPDSTLLFQDLFFELENGSIHDSLFITKHAKRLEAVIEAAISNLDDQQTLKDYVIELGKLHVTKYGVTHRLTKVVLLFFASFYSFYEYKLIIAENLLEQNEI